MQNCIGKRGEKKVYIPREWTPFRNTNYEGKQQKTEHWLIEKTSSNSARSSMLNGARLLMRNQQKKLAVSDKQVSNAR